MKKLRINKKKVLDFKNVTYNRSTKKAVKNADKKIEKEVKEVKKPKEKESK